MPDVVIAVDPGRDKCGVAVVERGGRVLDKKVIETARLAEVVEALARSRGITTVVLGDRTSHHAAARRLAAITVDGGQLIIALVDEHRSSDEARGRYWRDNPPRGLARLVPLGLQTPAAPVDDYVAVILAERYFAQEQKG